MTSAARNRPLWLTALLLIVTLAMGIIVRFVPLDLPFAVVKYGGSVFWALAIYWIVSALLLTGRLLFAAMLAGTLATAVEFAKLYHSPALDAFRLTLPGILLLGRYFSVWDIVAYWAAIGVGAVLDAKLRRR